MNLENTEQEWLRMKHNITEIVRDTTDVKKRLLVERRSNLVDE